jgi:hypothetical protein
VPTRRILNANGVGGSQAAPVRQRSQAIIRIAFAEVTDGPGHGKPGAVNPDLATHR